MRAMRTSLAAGTVLAVGLALGPLSSAAAAAPQMVGAGTSKILVIDGDLYAVSLGVHEVIWGTSLSSVQTGDVRVRKFSPRSGGDTARFTAGKSLDVTVTPPSGLYLGEPAVYPIRSGILFCRVNPAAVEGGRLWSVDTAVYSTDRESWSSLRRTPVTTDNGQYGACLGAAGDAEEHTVIVGSRSGLDSDQTLISLSFAGSRSPAVRPYAQELGWVSGADHSGNADVAVNAATGLVDFYRGDQIPVTIDVLSNVRREDGSVRRVARAYIVFFDTTRQQWTQPRQVFSSGIEAAEDVVGESSISDLRALVSPDGSSVHLLAGQQTVTAVPEWPSVPVTSITRVAPNNNFYASTVVVGMSAADAARRDWRASTGWTLTYTDDSGPQTFPATILRTRQTSLVAFVGPGAAVTPVGTLRNARLSFTGNPDDFSNAEIEWTRLMQTTSLKVLARTLRGNDLGPVVTLPGERSANGWGGISVHATAAVDGLPMVLIEREDSRSRSSISSATLINGEWTRPQPILSEYNRDDYDQPVVFMPFGRRTALIGAQDTSADRGLRTAQVTDGVFRRVFANGRWGAPEYIRSLETGEDLTVAAVARLTGSEGPVEVEVITRVPSVAALSARYDLNERINGSAFGTVTYRYRGSIPRGARGFVAVQGWSGQAWQSGSYDPVIDEAARTIKMSTPAPTTPAPTTAARITWTELLETVYVVDRRR